MRASERSAIAPFMVMDVMRAAASLEAEGREVLHLEVGQPCTQAPAGARAAAHRAVDDDLLGYTVALGMTPLRERIAQHCQDWYGQTVDPAQVAITAGASAGFMLACLAAFDPGDRVVITAPGYPCYRNTLLSLGLEPVTLRVGPQTHYRVTPEALVELARELGPELGPIKGLVVASPSNPTGTLLDAAHLDALCRHCQQAGIRLISDEIYHGLTYDGLGGRAVGVEVTATGRDPDAIVINSFSKYFSMTGWRIGWMVLPPELVRRVELLSQNLLIAPSTLSQHAALSAFECYAELDLHTQRYAHNRAIVLEGLASAGVTEVAPADGAFYVYADVAQFTDDSVRLCAAALEGLGVAITPGLDFDPERGRSSIRLSYARSTDEVARAVSRLAEWLPRQRPSAGTRRA